MGTEQERTRFSRRKLLAGIGGTATVALAGCLGDDDGSDRAGIDFVVVENDFENRDVEVQYDVQSSGEGTDITPTVINNTDEPIRISIRYQAFDDDGIDVTGATGNLASIGVGAINSDPIEPDAGVEGVGEFISTSASDIDRIEIEIEDLDS